MPDAPLKIAVAGAGSIGCYVGGMLRAAGHDVVFIGRPSMAERFARDGLHVQSMSGKRGDVAPADLSFSLEPETAKGATHVVVCVKSMATAEMAEALKSNLSENALVVSLQNGLDNTDVLRNALPGHTVCAGVVTFNVVQQDGNRFVATTEGGIHLQNSPAASALCYTLDQAGIGCELHDDMQAVQWSKLLLNLNNALNALSGKPLAEQLRDRSWRKVLAACVREGIAVARAGGITPVRIGKVKPQIIPLVLSLPDFLFERVASQMPKVDPKARSSMADDLKLGRRPEIDHLNGAIVSHGQETRIETPMNAKVCEAVRRLFAGNIKAPVDPGSF